MAFFKALIPGFILTFIVSLVIGSNGSQGGFLNIFLARMSGHHMYWSWPLFFAATGISWVIIAVME